MTKPNATDSVRRQEEFENSIFQPGLSNTSNRHGRSFAHEGIAMLSSVFRSPQAVAVNVEIMPAFARMRGLLLSVADLVRKAESLERSALAHDSDLAAVFKALRQLMTPCKKCRREIGFHTNR